MKKFFIALFLSAVCGAFASDPLTVGKRLMRAYETDATFMTVNPFTAEQLPKGKKRHLRKAEWLRPDMHQLSVLAREKPETLRMSLPMHEQQLELDLVRVELIKPDFHPKTSQGETIDYEHGAFYHGIISGREDSLVAISIFDDHVMGVVQTPEDGDLVLGPIEDDSDDFRHVFYKTSDFEAQTFQCGTETPPDYHKEVKRLLERPLTGRKSSNDGISVYIECDYQLYKDRYRSTTYTLNFALGLFNVVASIYANEGIPVFVNETMVWTTQDPYSTTSSLDALLQFKTRPHNSDLAHLFARGGNDLGGRAWINTLCTALGYAYSNIHNSYSTLPSYSWSADVVTHEMGHNLGSPHTHDCVWIGGALDNCATTVGGCAPGPTPYGGGTVMSYCHQTSHGINLNKGLGFQPGNLIRSILDEVHSSCVIWGPPLPSVLKITTDVCYGYNTATWNQVMGASWYFLYSSTSNDPSTATVHWEGSGNYVPLNVSQTRYFWVVASYHGYDSPFSNRAIAYHFSNCR